MAHFMLKQTYSASSGALMVFKYNIFTQKCFVVKATLPDTSFARAGGANL